MGLGIPESGMKTRQGDNSKIRNPKSEIRNQDFGTLYIVSTPIGNFEDITLRALRILKNVDLIAAESVQHSRGLCRHYGIKKRLISFNQHNQKVKGSEIIRKLKSGFDVALVTNAGTPGVSDPGGFLINRALEDNIKVSPIPGPSAITAAFSVSGMRSDRFLFLGFLSNRSGRRRKDLKELLYQPHTMVFFEAPHRMQAMLRDLMEILGDREVVILRELTKAYEEVIRGSVSSVLGRLKGAKVKGEFTLIVAGSENSEEACPLDEEAQKKIEKLLKEDRMSMRDIATQLSVEEGLAYRNIYKECLSIKRAMQPF